MESAAREHSDGSQDLSEDVVARLDARRVRQAMTSLPVKQRQAVVLKYVDGRTVKEISDELCLPLGTVKTRIRDGLAAVAPRAEIRLLSAPPVLGAALLGLDALGAPAAAATRLRSSLLETAIVRLEVG